MKVEEKWQETGKMCKHVARRRIERKAGGRGKCGLRNSKKRNTGPRLWTVLRFKGSAESLRDLWGLKHVYLSRNAPTFWIPALLCDIRVTLVCFVCITCVWSSQNDSWDCLLKDGVFIRHLDSVCGSSMFLWKELHLKSEEIDKNFVMKRCPSVNTASPLCNK